MEKSRYMQLIGVSIEEDSSTAQLDLETEENWRESGWWCCNYRSTRGQSESWIIEVDGRTSSHWFAKIGTWPRTCRIISKMTFNHTATLRDRQIAVNILPQRFVDKDWIWIVKQVKELKRSRRAWLTSRKDELHSRIEWIMHGQTEVKNDQLTLTSVKDWSSKLWPGYEAWLWDDVQCCGTGRDDVHDQPWRMLDKYDWQQIETRWDSELKTVKKSNQ